MTTWTKPVTIAAVAAIAFAMALTSFGALADLARSTGLLTGKSAYALPVALDGMVLVASLAVVTRRQADQDARYSWMLVGLYTVLSVAGNVAHAWPKGTAAIVIAAIFPLTLLLAFEQLLAILAHHTPPAAAEVDTREQQSVTAAPTDARPVTALAATDTTPRSTAAADTPMSAAVTPAAVRPRPAITADTDTDSRTAEGRRADTAPVMASVSPLRPVTGRLALSAAADTSPAPDVDAELAHLVAGYLAAAPGRAVDDAELTKTVAERLAVTERTARRRLKPLRDQPTVTVAVEVAPSSRPGGL